MKEAIHATKAKMRSYRPDRCRFFIGSAMRGVGPGFSGEIHIRQSYEHREADRSHLEFTGINLRYRLPHLTVLTVKHMHLV